VCVCVSVCHVIIYLKAYLGFHPKEKVHFCNLEQKLHLLNDVTIPKCTKLDLHAVDWSLVQCRSERTARVQNNRYVNMAMVLCYLQSLYLFAVIVFMPR